MSMFKTQAQSKAATAMISMATRMVCNDIDDRTARRTLEFMADSIAETHSWDTDIALKLYNYGRAAWERYVAAWDRSHDNLGEERHSLAAER